MKPVVFEIDGSKTGKRITNKTAVMNQWDFRREWTEKQDIVFPTEFPFVKDMQFMTATGGNAQRDLFIEPENSDILDDYDFSPLITACRNTLVQGLKPFIKTGNVPLKYSSAKPKIDVFGVNVYAPLDYSVYRDYISAMAEALCKAFGKEEVCTWKWGVLTEYENASWFENGENSPEAYFKLYDYTVDGLQRVLGDDIYVGAHSMTVAEGLWDERLFIRHCASGTNYATGTHGTRLCYLASSFYDITPEKPEHWGMADCIRFLRDEAEACGLTNLDYGIDEGRILNGTDNLPLTSRTVGFTYQAAHDAHLYKEMIDNDVSWFSAWCYLSGDTFHGLKTVAYHTARRFWEMAGSDEITVKCDASPDSITLSEAVASYNKDKNKVYIMAYHFGRTLERRDKIATEFRLNLPMFENAGRVAVTRYTVDDSANFFDKWYSPDVKSNTGWSTQSARCYVSIDTEKYEPYSRLIPVTEIIENDNRTGLSLKNDLQYNGVVFYEITPAD